MICEAGCVVADPCHMVARRMNWFADPEMLLETQTSKKGKYPTINRNMLEQKKILYH